MITAFIYTIFVFISVVAAIAVSEALYSHYNKKPKSYVPDVEFTISERYKLEVFLQIKKEYLQSTKWQIKRQQVLSRDNFCCTECGTTENLEVHHDKGYSLIPHEPISNLRTLCRKHHQEVHNIHGYPQTLEEYFTFDSTPTPMTI